MRGEGIILLEKLFNENVLIYTMMSIFCVGIILKFILYIGYLRIIKASRNIEHTENKTLRDMRIKFETFHKLKIGVNNVDVFVDKELINHKICGLWLITWEKISGQVDILCVTIACTSVLIGIIFEIDRMWILSVLTVGLLTSGLLIFCECMLNKNIKRDMIRLNILDYFCNFLKPRMEQEKSNPEIIQEYKKAIEEVSFKQEESTIKEACFRQWKAKRRSNREKRKATRLFKKQARIAARRKRREANKKRRIEEKQAAKLAKACKKEEKAKQAEIKKALGLEKQLTTERKKTQKKTPAEERKERLKKEIEEIRRLEARKNDQVAATMVDDINSSSKDNESITIADSDQSKTPKQNKTKLKKQDEKIIEEILKKYLA